MKIKSHSEYTPPQDIVDPSKRKFLKFLGLSSMTALSVGTCESINTLRAEAKQFQYPTEEQKKAINDLKEEALVSPEVYAGIRLVVNLKDQEMILYKNSLPGQPDSEIVAKFIISSGTTFTNKKGQKVPFFTPKGDSGVMYVHHNPTFEPLIVGEWIPFREGDTGNAGFHGVPENLVSKLGTKQSHGCVRMRVQDIKSIVDLVRVGTQVSVRD